MNWLELYHLRASVDAIEELEKVFPILKCDFSNLDNFVRIQVLRPEDHLNELLVSIEWKGTPSSEGSIVGLSLKEHLSKFGLVREGIWVVSSMNQNIEMIKTL